MKLSVVSLKGVEFEGEIKSLNLKTTSGEITVLDNHRPIITALAKGPAVIIKSDGETFNIDIESGFLEVNENNQASILAGVTTHRPEKPLLSSF